MTDFGIKLNNVKREKKNDGDFVVEFRVILRGKEFKDRYLIKHEFLKKLQACYNKEGIEIPLPIRIMHLHERED